MHTNFILRLLIAILLLGLQSYLLPIASVLEVHAQATTLSLITPYYGTKTINSYFDHRYPTFNDNPNYDNDDLVIYNGKVSIGEIVDIENCYNTPDTVNCYDGHNGYDLAMDYEHVLAASDGIVLQARWYVVNCHNGPGCDYGLEVEIKHIVNGQIFRTRYGHLTTIAVQVDQSVRAGQIIGTSGSTGASTGPHLHFDVSFCINSNCQIESDFRAIDPFGWQPAPGAPVQLDPWALAQNPSGANSWCMWRDGQFVNFCDPNRPSSPIQEPIYGVEIIVDDTTDNTLGFSKGYSGPWSNPCTGIDPGCREWWQVSGGSSYGYGNRAYHTITNGLIGNYNTKDNWAKWKPQSLNPGNYEIFIWVPESLGYSSNTYTWQANFTVVDITGGLLKKIVDENTGDGQDYDPRSRWLSIGVYSLDANSYVYLTDDGEPSDAHCPTGALNNGHYWCRVAADAVKFVPVYIRTFQPMIHQAF